MIAKILHFIPCFIAYRRGLYAVHYTGSPYRANSLEDRAWRKGWENGQQYRNRS